MSDDVHDMNHEGELGADALRARDAVRGLGVPEADAGFRASLREAFVGGGIGAGVGAEVGAGASGAGAGAGAGADASAGTLGASASADADGRAASAAQAAAASRTQTRIRPHARAPWTRRRFVVPVAAAAAVLVFMFAPFMHDPGLNIQSVQGARQIVLNGELVPCDELSPIQAALQPGCRIEVPADATVEVAGAGSVLMDLQGVAFTFPDTPHRVLGGDFQSTVEGDGTVRMATAPGFEGKSYRLRLGDAELSTTGSVFTVARKGGEIEISVLEGELEARLPDGSTRMVGPGSGVMIRSGAFMPMEMDELEVELLRSLRDRAVVI